MAKHIADYISKMLLEERKEQNNILDSLQPSVFAPVLVCCKAGEIAQTTCFQSLSLFRPHTQLAYNFRVNIGPLEINSCEGMKGPGKSILSQPQIPHYFCLNKSS